MCTPPPSPVERFGASSWQCPSLRARSCWASAAQPWYGWRGDAKRRKRPLPRIGWIEKLSVLCKLLLRLHTAAQSLLTLASSVAAHHSPLPGHGRRELESESYEIRPAESHRHAC